MILFFTAFLSEMSKRFVYVAPISSPPRKKKILIDCVNIVKIVDERRILFGYDNI